jgi:hypothetical protein
MGCIDYPGSFALVDKSVKLAERMIATPVTEG